MIYLHILTQLGITAVGEMPGIGRETGRGMCQEFGDRIFLVQDYLRRGTVYRRWPRSQVVDCPLPLAQLDHRVLHRHEGHTVVRQSKIVSHSESMSIDLLLLIALNKLASTHPFSIANTERHFFFSTSFLL